ncbi:hypothetical protein GDO86_002272 [Hymenochirus boettgeri]|uniref:PH domain-containing protein n=1 Tax=Hymenochirus boettgeri TaxID=247094 RepID=A0A8T2KM72_9PIPI|nr:hypothetical protein GDO86_002272 [Hymenochirus boettgeri]
MQKAVRCNEAHAVHLALVARKEGTKRGVLGKKAAETNRWHDKWFALYQNVLFYFESEQSGRPSGMYLLEGGSCERVTPPLVASGGKDTMEKQQTPSQILYTCEKTGKSDRSSHSLLPNLNAEGCELFAKSCAATQLFLFSVIHEAVACM